MNANSTFDVIQSRSAPSILGRNHAGLDSANHHLTTAPHKHGGEPRYQPSPNRAPHDTEQSRPWAYILLPARLVNYSSVLGRGYNRYLSTCTLSQDRTMLQETSSRNPPGARHTQSRPPLNSRALRPHSGTTALHVHATLALNRRGGPAHEVPGLFAPV